ncbi:MAG: PaaI family thioesterase [Candidatus Nezhaarchaeales archaeon]|nr:PaaI family thioesterase [Candidatus Nezhaarchaeota archaeon]
MERWLESVSSAPWYRLIGMKPRFRNGEIVVELDLEEKHHQVLGVAHGGVVASVLDSAIALNVNKELIKVGRVAVTAQLNVHYLKPVSRGRIVGVGRPLHIGNRIAVGYGEAMIGDDLIATATALLVIR